MRTVGRIVLGLLVLVVAIVGYFILTFNPETYKPQIVAAVKQATGRDLQIKGHIGLGWSLSPTIEVSDVTLSNPSGFSRPDMASIGKVDLQLALMPLLGKRIEIDRLTLSKPDVRLETDAKGQPNWIFTPQATPATATPSGGAPAGGGSSGPMAVAIKDIRIENGVFTYRNGRTGETNTLAVKQMVLQEASLDAPLHATAAISLDGTDIGIVADTGSLGHLTGAIKGLWTIKLGITVAGAKIGIDGGMADPIAGTGLDLGVTANVPDLAALGVAVKQALPPLKSVTFAARLAGDPRKFSFHDMKVASSAGDFAGDLTVTMGLPIGLIGTLKSEKLDLDALSVPATPAAAKPAPGPAVPTAPVAPKSKWLISDQKLPVGQLQTVNADLRIAMGVLHVGGSDYKAIQAHVLLKDGILTLDPASADLPQGHVSLTLSADAGKTEPPVHLTLRAPGIALAPLLASLGEPPYIAGNLEVIADLRGAGESPHAIAASLDGTLTLVVAGGTLDTKRIGGSASGVMQALNPKAGSAANAMRCLVVRFDFAHGVGTARALTLGSALLNVDGGGTVNLMDETLALLLRSRASVAGTAVTVPLNVFGSLAAPQTKVDEIGIAQSNAATLGGLFGGPVGAAIAGSQRQGAGDSCPGALALAHGQAAPAVPTGAAPAPAPAPANPSPGGQLLQKLFH
jgi:uncharacterized protein involved in outer membrane biogenesis